MKKKTKFIPCPYLKRYVFRHIKWYLHEIKYAWQRMMYGYSDLDVMDADYFFLKTMANVLEDLKNTTDGYPFTEENIDTWKEKLGYIVFCLREAQEDICSKNQEIFNFIDLKEYEKLSDEAKNEYDKKKEEWFNREKEVVVLMKNDSKFNCLLMLLFVAYYTI